MTFPSEAPRRRRRWLIGLSLTAVGLLAALVLAAIFLPRIVGLPWTQKQLGIQANRIMAPGRVRFERVDVSWSRPTEIRGLVLLDPQGDEVVASSQAHFSWNLWEILFTRPGMATLTLDPASVDIERSA